MFFPPTAILSTATEDISPNTITSVTWSSKNVKFSLSSRALQPAQGSDSVQLHLPLTVNRKQARNGLRNYQ